MYEIILIAGLLFILTFIAFRVIKSAATVVFLTVGVLILIVVIGSTLIYFDAKNLRENTLSSKTTIILTNNNYTSVFAGFIMNLDNTSKSTPLKTEDLNLAATALKKKNYDVILNNSYKLIIIPEKSLQTILGQDIIINENSKISNNDFFVIAKSSTPIDIYLEKVVASIAGIDSTLGTSNIRNKIKDSIKKNISSTDDEFKGRLFSAIFERVLLENPEKIILEYKARRVIIYPETILLKILRMIPDDTIKKQFSEIKEKAKTKVVVGAKDAANNVINNKTAENIRVKLNRSMSNLSKSN